MSSFERLCAETEAFCQKNNLLSCFEHGVAVALSGGADSVFLLRFTHLLSQKKQFPLCAFHVNHGLREEESDHDETFCRSLCQELKIPFFAVRVSVLESKERFGGTIEEVARRERYRAFADFLNTHSEYAYFLTAHTASDNLETLLFRLARGTGLRGLCGIPLRRECFFRPLLSLSGKEIRDSLDESSYPYVFDSSNLNLCYRRNYIRREIVPPFLRIHEDAEKAAARVCRNLSIDEDYLAKESSLFLETKSKNGCIERNAFANLHMAIFIRVIDELYRQAGGVSGCEGVHFEKAYNLLKSDKASSRVDFPDKLCFVIEKQTAFFEKKQNLLKKEKTSFEQTELSFGENLFLPNGVGITLKKEKDDAYYASLKRKYSQVFFADLSASYIGGNLYLRERKDGDSYRYGGMTHKVKKLFSDRKLSLAERKKRLLICDSQGILWIPGFAVREPNDKKTTTIYAYFFMNGGNDE